MQTLTCYGMNNCSLTSMPSDTPVALLSFLCFATALSLLYTKGLVFSQIHNLQAVHFLSYLLIVPLLMIIL